MIGVCAAALGLGRWSVELLTIAEYSGLDNAMQHLAMYKLAQLVRTAPTWLCSPHSLLCCSVAGRPLSQPAARLLSFPSPYRLASWSSHLCNQRVYPDILILLWMR